MNFFFVGDEGGCWVKVGESCFLDVDIMGIEIFGGGMMGVKSLFKIVEDFVVVF